MQHLMKYKEKRVHGKCMCGDVDIVSHVWVDSKASWYEIADKLPQFRMGIDSDKVDN